MQAGFAMVEAGFTRAKNAGNIVMKNTLDFSIGAVVFLFLGYGLLSGANGNPFIGTPDLGWLGAAGFAEFNWSDFFFQLVFCATATTIVSGAMAERTKFGSYLALTIVICALIYPIETHWVWGGGWLSELGFLDWAGSAVIHMVGGIIAFMGAAFLGARIGKYDASGKSNAIPGHSITLGALGVFILWFGWYGFNGAAGGTVAEVAAIFSTTTLAAVAAAIAAMVTSWVMGGKPDVTFTLTAPWPASWVSPPVALMSTRAARWSSAWCAAWPWCWAASLSTRSSTSTTPSVRAACTASAACSAPS